MAKTTAKAKAAKAKPESKPRRRKRDGGTTAGTTGEVAGSITMTLDPKFARAPGTLPGFTSADLHPQIVEALKAFEKACDHYDNAVASIDGQYLNALVNSPAADQVAALRGLF